MEDEPGDVLRAGSPTALCSAGKGDDVMYVPHGIFHVLARIVYLCPGARKGERRGGGGALVRRKKHPSPRRTRSPCVCGGVCRRRGGGG